jgi:lysine 2,3-aminomutase
MEAEYLDKSIAGASSATPDDWKWQLRNAVRTVDDLNQQLALFTDRRVQTSDKTERIANELFNFKVTPFMISALRRGLESNVPGTWNAFCAAFTPTELEVGREDRAPSLRADSIGEDLLESHPAPGITRFYKNRALLRVSHMCPAYCRYCFRRRLVGDEKGAWNQQEVDASISYIQSDSAISEVIISGGEPLVLGDKRIDHVLARLDDIGHVRRVRIDTKALTMIPQRVTSQLCGVLRTSKMTAVIGHFTHSYELVPEVERAASRLVDAGIPVYAHIPLLRNVNDDEAVLEQLVERLADLRIRPYYLIHFIPTGWTEHFRVSIARGLELIEYLQRRCTGLAIPAYIVYLPDGHGKVQLAPSHLVRRSEDGYIFRAHDGADVLYSEPLHNDQRVGSDYTVRD